MSFRSKINEAVSLEDYYVNVEKELIKSNLNCRCDNYAGGWDDGGAMRLAHMAAVGDLLDPFKCWVMAAEMDRKLAGAYQDQVDLRGWARVDFAQWENVKKDKAGYDSQVRVQLGNLLAFEDLNEGRYCDMRIGEAMKRFGWA